MNNEPTNDSENSRLAPVQRRVRRCPICHEADGTMINYVQGRGEWMMHPICAARHFQQALEKIVEGVFPGSCYRNGKYVYAEEILAGKHTPKHDV